MTLADLGVLVRGIAPVLKAYVGAAVETTAAQVRDLAARVTAGDEHLRALAARLDALEAKPTLAYDGVWKEGVTYPAGACVTRAGGLWIARHATSARPGDPADASRAWTLAVKRGHAS